MAERQYLKLVEDVYLSLDRSYDGLYQAASAAERLQLRALHASARDAYWEGVAKELIDDNAVVEQIALDLKATTRQLKSQLKAMAGVGPTLDAATRAVRLAAALVTLART